MTSEWSRCVSEALAKNGWVAAAPGSFRTTLANGASLAVCARLDDPWLRIEAEIMDAVEPPWWRLLDRSRALPPDVRLALAASARTSARLVMDLACTEPRDWMSRIPDATGALIAGAGDFHGGAPEDRATEPEAGLPDHVQEAIRGSGWVPAGATETRIELPLDREGQTVTALAATQGGRLCMWAPLTRSLGPEDHEASEAVACFLLHASHRLRAVRPSARRRPAGPGSTVGWEAWLPLSADSGQVDRALAALTVASRHSMREVAALSSPALARRYLIQHGA